MRRLRRSLPLRMDGHWFVLGLVILVVALDAVATVAATGDPRCLFVKCVVVK